MPLFEDLYPIVLDADLYVQSDNDTLYNDLYTIIYNYTTGLGIVKTNIDKSILLGSIGKNSDFEIENLFYLEALIGHLIRFKNDVDLICGDSDFDTKFATLESCYKLVCIRNTMVCKFKTEKIFDQMYAALNLCGNPSLSIFWENNTGIDWES